MIEERDISIAMRDGTRLRGRLSTDSRASIPYFTPRPCITRTFKPRHRGHIAAAAGSRAALVRSHRGGDTRRFIANGYVHAIAQPRGSAKSEGHYGHEDTTTTTHRMDHAATMVKRQGRNGRHFWLCRRTVACRHAGTSRAESHLSVRRV